MNTKLTQTLCVWIAACGASCVVSGDSQKMPGQNSLGKEALPPFPGTALVATNEPIGQIITAEQAQLQSVEFAFRVPTVLGGEGKVETLAVKLRAGNIDGEVLSSTTPVVLAWPGSIQPLQVEFQFMDLPLLQVGQRYALQITHLAGDPIFEALSLNPGSYGMGAMIYKGVEYDDVLGSDLWFQTGYIIPEPSTVALFTIGGTLMVLVRRKPHSPKLGRS
jgi:hypothetical protein